MEGCELQVGAQGLLPPGPLCKVIFILNLDRELLRLVWVPRGAAGARLASASPGGAGEPTANPGLLWNLPYIAKSRILGNLPGLD